MSVDQASPSPQASRHPAETAERWLAACAAKPPYALRAACDLHELGDGLEAVYAYGYRCAPDRLKIGRCAGDPVSRVAAQISTASPDKPSLYLIVRTNDCAALERVLHGVFRLRGRRVPGAGAEWFRVSRDEIIDVVEKVAIEERRGPIA